MIYDIRHRTTFTYEDVVSVSHHVLHLTPRRHRRQRCLSSAMLVDPAPAVDSSGEDYFGNPVHYLTVQEPHERLVVESRSRVEVVSGGAAVDLEASKPWEEVRELLAEGAADDLLLQTFEFTFDSPYSAGNDDVRDYALRSFAPGRPILAAAMDLTTRIYREFEYRGGVSDVSTPVRDVFAMRKGVCQDFAHFEIACLRSLGLAARYVSGYLLTHPAPGKEKLVGSDASHAWLSVWSAEAGWVDFDPTNNLIPDVEHVTVGWGRDYGDVSPINGFIVGGGSHQVAVAVDVNPVASAAG
ncbi:MAG TPA: transglutaminase family protein [Gammaproteobacteria bacterium]|nr:transglutaminase family protein [Gammaproteobacteria bacterium]